VNFRIIFLVLTLAGCSFNPPSPATRKPAAITPSAAEQALLAKYPSLVRRESNVLKVASRGGWITYENRDCEVSSDCASYSLDRAFLNGRLFGIEVRYYEGGDYTVADTESLHECTGGSPVFSPDNQLFAVAVYDEAYETCGQGVGLWRLDFPLRKIRTVSPSVLTYPQNLRWRGNACVEFTAIEGFEYNEAARRTYYLVKDEPEWRLERQRARPCTAADATR
jgi:hypothetical protein